MYSSAAGDPRSELDGLAQMLEPASPPATARAPWSRGRSARPLPSDARLEPLLGEPAGLLFLAERRQHDGQIGVPREEARLAARLAPSDLPEILERAFRSCPGRASVRAAVQDRCPRQLVRHLGGHSRRARAHAPPPRARRARSTPGRSTRSSEARRGLRAQHPRPRTPASGSTSRRPPRTRRRGGGHDRARSALP